MQNVAGAYNLFTKYLAKKPSYNTLIKFSFSENATKIWSYHPFDLMFTKQKSNPMGDDSKFLWPSQKS